MSSDASTRQETAPRPKRRPEWVTQIALPVAVSVVGTLLVTALTPVGESVRELLFPTRAVVAGTVGFDGQAAAKARLRLDQADAGTTDADGHFLLTSVGKGKHQLLIEAIGARPREWAFAVARGEAKVDTGAIDVEPLLTLGFAAVVQPPRFSERESTTSISADVDYDITLWLAGEDSVISQVKEVSYTLPAPLTGVPTAGAGGDRSFCYRQVGTLRFQELFVLGGAFAAASSAIDLGDGKPFQISAPPGQARPPNCPAKQVRGAATEVPPAEGPVKVSPPQNTQPVTLILVPDLRGVDAEVARTMLEALSFEVTDKSQGSDEVAKDDVIGTIPAAGKKVREGSKVTLLISAGKLVKVPNVVGQKQEVAVGLLQQAGLKVDIKDTKTGGTEGTIIAQRPAPGAEVAVGSTVELHVEVPTSN